MLSVLFAESYDNVAHLLRFYAPNAPRLLDVTYGAGTLVKKSPIPVVGVDKDPESKAQVIAEVGALPFADGSFAVAVADPPYLYGTPAMHMGPVGQKTWSNTRSTWKTPDDLTVFAVDASHELNRVLVPKGIVIIKIMNCRYKGRIARNDHTVIECFDEYFTLRDQIVYLRTVTGSFVNPRSAQSAHGFFLVFEKRN